MFLCIFLHKLQKCTRIVSDEWFDVKLHNFGEAQQNQLLLFVFSQQQYINELKWPRQDFVSPILYKSDLFSSRRRRRKSSFHKHAKSVYLIFVWKGGVTKCKLKLVHLFLREPWEILCHLNVIIELGLPSRNREKEFEPNSQLICTLRGNMWQKES